MRKTKAQLEQEIKELKKTVEKLEKEIELKKNEVTAFTVDSTGLSNMLERSRITSETNYKGMVAETERAGRFASYLFWTAFISGVIIISLVSYIIL